MKATGIVRRIDELGRVVIPKEIRRSLKIREGDALEVFVDNGGICFRKYQTEVDWDRVNAVATILLKEPYALLDTYEDIVKYRGNAFGNEKYSIGEDIGYLVTADPNGAKVADAIAEMVRE